MSTAGSAGIRARRTKHDTQHLNLNFERSTKMSFIQEDLARAHIGARLSEARSTRRGRNLAAARRLSRKAERAAAQARLAVARVI